jgi:nucleoside-diphosphate-sugar epimerase
LEETPVGGGIAVVGAGGFVGARMLEMAALAGHHNVVPIVRSYRSVARSAHLAMPHRLADATDPEALARAIAGCDVVVNLTAGPTGQIVRTTESVYRATASAGARLLMHLSSATVFGRIEQPDLADDARPRRDLWMAYAREKGRAEDFLRAQMGNGAVTVVVLRPSLIWGPGSPWVLGPATALTRAEAYLIDEGEGVCNLMYVDDLVRGIHAVAAHPAPRPGFFNVGDDVVPTWRAYYTALAEGLGIDPKTIHVARGGRYRARPRERLEGLRSRVRVAQGPAHAGATHRDQDAPCAGARSRCRHAA